MVLGIQQTGHRQQPGNLGPVYKLHPVCHVDELCKETKILCKCVFLKRKIFASNFHRISQNLQSIFLFLTKKVLRNPWHQWLQFAVVIFLRSVFFDHICFKNVNQEGIISGNTSSMQLIKTICHTFKNLSVINLFALAEVIQRKTL